MELGRKIEILAEAAKYDVSCSSSGVEKNKRTGSIGRRLQNWLKNMARI